MSIMDEIENWFESVLAEAQTHLVTQKPFDYEAYIISRMDTKMNELIEHDQHYFIAQSTEEDGKIDIVGIVSLGPDQDDTEFLYGTING